MCWNKRLQNMQIHANIILIDLVSWSKFRPNFVVNLDVESFDVG